MKKYSCRSGCHVNTTTIRQLTNEQSWMKGSYSCTAQCVICGFKIVAMLMSVWIISYFITTFIATFYYGAPCLLTICKRSVGSCMLCNGLLSTCEQWYKKYNTFMTQCGATKAPQNTHTHWGLSCNLISSIPTTESSHAPHLKKTHKHILLPL